MTDWLLALVPQYGVWLLAGSTFLSCLALPIPASILMLAAGGFASAGDLSMTGAAGAALAGAVAGDQTGYFAGRAGGAGLGLAICREVMANLGGTITYLPGQGGAAFRATIPLRLERKAA